MREQYRLTQKTLFAFLQGTGLPLVSSLASLLRWSALVLALAGVIYGVGVLLLVEDSLWNPRLPWSGALPVLVTSPIYLLAWQQSRLWRMHRSAVLLFLGLCAISILATWPRGAFSPAWYVQPFLALLATCALGIVPGLTLTLMSVTGLLTAAVLRAPGSLGANSLPDMWTHTTSLAAVTLASALLGALLHKLLLAALTSAEEQRERIRDSRKALRYREKLLRHALRVETVGELAGLVVHQLRNQFQVMIGHVALGRRGDEKAAMHRLEQIGEALHEARPLLDQLMGMAHPEDGELVAVDLNDIADQFFEKARRVLPSVIELSLATSRRATLVLVDPRGLEHALWNLVMNARQALGGPGSIEVRSGADDDSAWVEVADSGPGIAPEEHARIFEPYYTTKPVGRGTGLGLTAVARFVRANHGTVELESELGRGSTFRMRFPLRPAMPTPDQARTG